jgi:7-keto-8-aminopelargonate synthetase-like enzyme
MAKKDQIITVDSIRQAVDAAEVMSGTLSKTLGGMGGFVVGSRDLIEYLVDQVRHSPAGVSLYPRGGTGRARTGRV